jgi:hypothetical protein
MQCTDIGFWMKIVNIIGRCLKAARLFLWPTKNPLKMRVSITERTFAWGFFRSKNETIEIFNNSDE